MTKTTVGMGTQRYTTLFNVGYPTDVKPPLGDGHGLTQSQILDAVVKASQTKKDRGKRLYRYEVRHDAPVLTRTARVPFCGNATREHYKVTYHLDIYWQ